MSLIKKPILDYTDKDFDSFRVRLHNVIKSSFPEWTDFNVASFGNILLDSQAFMLDVLMFYLDNHALESRITTATQRRNLIALAKLVGYTPYTATAATADVVFTIPSALTYSVVIPKGTILQTESPNAPLSFQTLSELIIPPGNTQGVVSVEHSQTHLQTFTGSGKGKQEIQLQFSPYLNDSEIVVAGNGIYSRVPDFLSTAINDLVYTLETDQNDRPVIQFGNGVDSQLPVGSITITYRTGGGSFGNVDANTIRIISTSIPGLPAGTSVNNPGAASGGTDRESNEQIRQNAPRSATTLNRSVTSGDYVTNALRCPGVCRAALVTNKERPGLKNNYGCLYLVPSGGGLPSQALKDKVLDLVTEEYPGLLCFNLEVKDPLYKSVNIEARVHIEKNGCEPLIVEDLKSKLSEYFALKNADGTENPNVGFGGQLPCKAIPYSDIYRIVSSCDGVAKVSEEVFGLMLNNDHADVDIEPFEFPILGECVIRNAVTNDVIFSLEGTSSLGSEFQ